MLDTGTSCPPSSSPRPPGSPPHSPGHRTSPPTPCSDTCSSEKQDELRSGSLGQEAHGHLLLVACSPHPPHHSRRPDAACKPPPATTTTLLAQRCPLPPILSWSPPHQAQLQAAKPPGIPTRDPCSHVSSQEQRPGKPALRPLVSRDVLTPPTARCHAARRPALNPSSATPLPSGRKGARSGTPGQGHTEVRPAVSCTGLQPPWAQQSLLRTPSSPCKARIELTA